MKPIIPVTAYKTRRDLLLEKIGDAILILPANTEYVRNRDCLFPFRQDSDFWYLSGFDEPSAIIVFDGKNKRSIIYNTPYDEHYAIWEGEIIGQERACKEYLFDEAYPIEEFDDTLLKFIYSFKTLITPFSRYVDFDNKILKAIKTCKETRRAPSPQNWLNSDQFIHPMRLVKDSYEQEMMKYTAEIAVAAHEEAMGITKPNMNEAEIAGLLDYRFAQKGGCPAYGHIVAGGNNACTLHYKVNNMVLNDGDLVLIDAGSEIDGYASDITRTYPVNGTFTEPQKRVYNWVLKSMKAAIDECKAGNHIRSPHFAAENVLIEAMIDLGLLTGSVEEIKAKNQQQQYFMHGTSHWIGLDVHDVGEYKDDDGEWMTLSAGYALTVEPGLYIREDDLSAPKELRGIGIRIEDDIIITENGHINLTDHAPKTIEEIERACSR